MHLVGVASLDVLQAGDPQRVGHYVLRGRLGIGPMGQVYLASSSGGRMVAVRVIPANLAEDAGFRARLAREVFAARKVASRFTAQIVDADLEGPAPWLVTGYVPGPSLSDAVERHGPLPQNSVLALAAGLAEGLSAIHAAGVIHRDLKPSNVLLAEDGPRIIDIGLSSAAETTELTDPEIIIGSPGYMSPEQAQGYTVGSASDVFSLAGVLIYAAQGEGPFGSGSAPALLYRVVHGEPVIENVPDHLRPLLEGCLSKDAKRRPTAAQFLADLSAAYPTLADLTNWLPGNVRSGQQLPTGMPMTAQSAAPAYPAAGDYYKAVQTPARSFTVRKLRAAEFVWDSIGPTLARGKSAVVFQATVEGRPQALRCYIRNDASSRERYSALDAYLAGHDLSPFVSWTTWLDGAIMVNRTSWPVLTMEWIDGRTLNKYVDFLATGSNAAALATLAARWRELVALLQRSEFAHGDLEHSNVMVDQEGRLRLVDYDTVWIPQLAGMAPATELGHPNYQHPSGRGWGRWMDTFSALVIYLSLVGLGKDPGLWPALYNSKNLLFDKADFNPPFKTLVWRRLAALHDQQVDELVRHLQECCAPSWVSAKSLQETLAGPFPQRPVSALQERNTPVHNRGYPGSGHNEAEVGSAPSPAVPGRIFISYRRDDTAYPCGWLFDKLTQHFGRDQVFKDIDSIELGDDFAEVITAAVEKCDVLLALIGRQWLTISEEDGCRRLDNPNDFVRLEIEAAITRNIRIIPVLVEGVRIPRVDELPASLAKLARRHALELSPSHFDSGIQRLLRVLDKALTSM